MADRADRAAGIGAGSPPGPPPREPAGPKRCLFCGVVLTGRWKRCGGCHAEFFCSNEHFVAAWPRHAAACNLVREREEAERRAGGLVLTAEADRELRAARAAAEAAADAAAEDALERARIERLNEAALRRELLRRKISLPADAPREALLAARLAAPDPTPEQNLTSCGVRSRLTSGALLPVRERAARRARHDGPLHGVHEGAVLRRGVPAGARAAPQGRVSCVARRSGGGGRCGRRLPARRPRGAASGGRQGASEAARRAPRGC